METLHAILQKAISLGATDVHLAPGQLPVYRVNRKLFFDETRFPMSREMLVKILEYFYTIVASLEDDFKENKQADISYTYNSNRFRINISITKGAPAFAIRVIPNTRINIRDAELTDIINKMKTINSGLILVTGKINSGKSTTMNAFIQEVNATENKKIVTLEDPIEYEHTSNKSIIIQKEIGRESDVISYYDGLINLLREDVDIAVLGEIRDRRTMEVALDLAESGGLVIGTLHTRSCGETIDRIINMYEAVDQASVKNTLSTVLKMVISQKLIVNTKNQLMMVPEVMMVNNTLASLIRSDRFSVSEIEDNIHLSGENGCLSFETSFTNLYIRGLVTMDMIKEQVDPERISTIKSLIISEGLTIDEKKNEGYTENN